MKKTPQLCESLELDSCPWNPLFSGLRISATVSAFTTTARMIRFGSAPCFAVCGASCWKNSIWQRRKIHTLRSDNLPRPTQDLITADYESLAPVHSDPQFYHVCCSLLNPYTLNLSGFSMSSPHRISIDLEPDRSLAAGSCCDELMADHNLAARQVQRWLQSTCGGRTGAEDALIINRTIRTSSSFNHNSPNRRFRLEALVWLKCDATSVFSHHKCQHVNDFLS